MGGTWTSPVGHLVPRGGRGRSAAAETHSLTSPGPWPSSGGCRLFQGQVGIGRDAAEHGSVASPSRASPHPVLHHPVTLHHPGHNPVRSHHPVLVRSHRPVLRPRKGEPNSTFDSAQPPPPPSTSCNFPSHARARRHPQHACTCARTHERINVVRHPLMHRSQVDHLLTMSDPRDGEQEVNGLDHTDDAALDGSDPLRP